MTVFPDFSLQDEDGYTRHSSEFHPGLFLWLRQLGCHYARRQAAQIRRLELLDPIRLVLISPSPPYDARAFRRHHLGQTACALLSDTHLRTYESLEMKRQHRPPLWSYLGEAKLGDPLQNGGAILTRPNGEIHYTYLSVRAGDHPKVDELQRAMRRLKL
ncbi:MAG: hypothetical protein KIS61_34055, partial [Candidatus Eremiobacteraeota bacterium]|nr:hypothetical protein [Candidatus Eremiobacteraeota bacterium]